LLSHQWAYHRQTPPIRCKNIFLIKRGRSRRGISQISQTCGLAPKSGMILPSHLRIVTGTGRAAIDRKGRLSYATRSGGVIGMIKNSRGTSGSSSKCTMHHRLCLHLHYLWGRFAKGRMWYLLPRHPARSAGSGMIGVNWNDGHGLLGPDGGETLSAYPPICAQGHQQNHKKNKKETDDTILKIVPMGSNVYLRSCMYIFERNHTLRALILILPLSPACSLPAKQ
jgi:hypothetical protein